MTTTEGRRPRREWTVAEQDIIRSVYPNGGIKAAAARLPERSPLAIYSQASKLGVKKDGEPSTPRRFYPATPEIDAAIFDTYGRAANGREAKVANLAAALDRPRWWVSTRARRLGLVPPRFKEPPWTRDEIYTLEATRGQSLRAIRRKLAERGHRRTETAIKLKLNRAGIGRDDPLHYSGRQLAALLGLDSKTVSSWLQAGHLYGRARGTRRLDVQGGDTWKIGRRDVRKFVIEHPERIDFHKVDKLWLIELLTDPTISA